MKLVHDKLSGSLFDDEVHVSNLVIENPEKFYDLINEFRLQCLGFDGGFSLFKDYDLIEIYKNVEFLTDPFSLHPNNKRVINKLYANLKQLIDTKLYLSTMEFLGRIKEYFNDISYYCDFDLISDQDIDFNSLFKAVNLRFNIEDDDSLYSKIALYIKIMKEFGSSVFVFTNFLCYLSADQVAELTKIIKSFDVYVLFIDNKDYEYNFFDKKYIIDMDLCEIY